jgi:hypothetical protein
LQKLVYDGGAVKRQRFIHHAREPGFEIEDIRALHGKCLHEHRTR